MNPHHFKSTLALFGILCAALIAGCAEGDKTSKDFFTSGNRDADQRAQQRMAKSQQLSGSKDQTKSSSDASSGPKVNEKPSLYNRLGGQDGIDAIVDDFVTRAMADPRVNWDRKGVKQGGFSFHRNKSVEWNASADNVKMLKLHMGQFLALATGGPTTYQGREMKSAHAGLHISNPEFDAAVGDLKATLDKLRIPTTEQKELLAIVESTRQEIVEER